MVQEGRRGPLEKLRKKRAACFRSVALLFMLSMIMVADHLPSRLIALGHAESVLAGISIRKPYSSLKDIERRWGPATKAAESQDRNPCEQLVSWSLNGVIVTASLECDAPGSQVIDGVQVEGTDPNRKFATGRGLSLGDPLEKAYRTYGRRLLLSPGPMGREILIQWRDGTELNATVTRDNRIVKIQLLPQSE